MTAIGEATLDHKPSAQFACSQQVLEAARKAVSKVTWDYINGAAGSETTLRRNRYALDCYAFLPRILRDVSKIDIATSTIGHRHSFAVGGMTGNGGPTFFLLVLRRFRSGKAAAQITPITKMGRANRSSHSSTV